LCEIGYYRDEALDVTCVKCPDGLITAMEGAVSEDNCTIGKICALVLRLNLIDV